MTLQTVDYLKDKYPHMFAWGGLIGLFHQDWMYDHPNWYSVVDDYLFSANRSLIYQEINGMLQEFDEKQLDSAFDSFGRLEGCGYCLDYDEGTNATWLRKIQEYIQNFVLLHKLEDVYALQVTGSAHKYPVGNAVFDGYDVKRQVLLFTRLFCYIEVPSIETLKEDTLSGKLTAWNEYYNRPYLIKYRNLSDYAKHQFTNLDRGKDINYPYRYNCRNIPDYITDSKSIEWHIGIKAHAESLQYLINGSAGLAIPESRLKVIYTPYIPPTPELALP